MSGRIGGTLNVAIDGKNHPVRSPGITYNLGRPKRETIMGADKPHGFKELPQVPFIEGEISDDRNFDLADFLDKTNVTVTAVLANGKTIVLRKAHYVSDGDVTSEEGAIQMRFEGENAEEVAA